MIILQLSDCWVCRVRKYGYLQLLSHQRNEFYIEFDIESSGEFWPCLDPRLLSNQCEGAIKKESRHLGIKLFLTDLLLALPVAFHSSVESVL